MRARISSRSNSARPPNTVNISRPCGLVMSAQVSFSERKPAPRFVTASMTLSRSRVEQASRSKAGDDEDVVGFEPADHLGQLGAVGLGPAGVRKNPSKSRCRNPYKTRYFGCTISRWKNRLIIQTLDMVVWPVT